MNGNCGRHKLFFITTYECGVVLPSKFNRACLSVCVSVCPIRPVTFESFHPKRHFGMHIRISRSSSYINVIGSRSRSQEKNCVSVLVMH